jgi:hypothetical protein
VRGPVRLRVPDTKITLASVVPAEGFEIEPTLLREFG